MTKPTKKELDALMKTVNSDYDQRLWLAFWAAGVVELRETFGFTEADALRWSELTKRRVEGYLGLGVESV